MSTPAVLPIEAHPNMLMRLFRRWKSFGGSFLFVSIVLHLLFGVGATVFIVQRIAAKRQLAFQGGPPAPTKSQRSVEHKVQVQKQKQQSSAPAPPKRIATTGLAKVTLPELPTIPTTSTSLTATKLSGMGGVGGFGLGPGTLGAAGGTGGGGGVPMFGLREAGGGSLKGTFYDLKQTAARQPTNMTPDQYGKTIVDFINGGWNEGLLNRYFRGPQSLYTTQIFVPNINADLGPAAFQLQDIVQPRMWAVLYKGTVIPSESGTYHFVGAGDDVLAVRFNGQLVLERNWYNRTNWKPVANYDYGFTKIKDGFAKGSPMNVEAGKSYPMEVIIGEQPGGHCFFALLLEKEGATYQKDSHGNPFLPLFRLADVKPPPPPRGSSLPPHAEGGPVWRATAAATTGPSLLDQMRNGR